MTKDQMSAKLKAIGLTRSYKPYWDGEGAGTIMLETRKFVINEGVMKGSQMDLYDDSTVRVWTSQKSKAMALSRANGFRVRLLDGEAELYIPVEKADMFLHGLGAKVKKNVNVSPELAARRLEALRNARANKKRPLAAVA